MGERIMENRKPRKVTIKLYQAVKVLLRAGETHQAVADYMGISKKTVSNISVSESYDDYLSIIAAINIKNKKYKQKNNPEPEPEQKPEPTPETKNHGVDMTKTYQMNRLIEVINKQNDILRDIREIMVLMGNKISYIVEELAGVPSQKGGEQG